MPRTRSETTADKINLVKEIARSGEAPTHRDIQAKIRKKFGTGLATKLVSAALASEGVKMKRGRRSSKKAGAKKRGPARTTRRATGKRRATKKARSTKFSPRRGRPKNPVTELGSHPRFFLSVPAHSFFRGYDKKTDLTVDIEKLVESGVPATDIHVYTQENLTVETRHSVKF